MAKPHISTILIPGSKLSSTINTTDSRTMALIEKTREEQAAVLKLKQVNPDLLKKVIQL